MRKFTKELKLINQARKILGKKPLVKMLHQKKGDWISKSCPLARAFKASVDCKEVIFDNITFEQMKQIKNVWKTRSDEEDIYKCIDLPKILVKFVKDFDNGKYPELKKR